MVADPCRYLCVEQNARRNAGMAGPEARSTVGLGHERDRSFSYFLRPNKAVPTRTCVAPSSMAASRSCDMPMES